MMNEWRDVEHARDYLRRAGQIPQREVGEATLVSEIPTDTRRVLDLGCGDGRLLDLVLAHCPGASGVGVDFSTEMLTHAERRFAGRDDVDLIEHDLYATLPFDGPFDCIVSSFAIHHCDDQRKKSLYEEILWLLSPGGVFCNLEHVSSPNERIHQRFVEAMGMTPEDEDPSNILVDVESQLRWLRELGFVDVDCFWKWRELALLIGKRPRNESLIPAGEIDDRPTPAERYEVCKQLESFNVSKADVGDFERLAFVVRSEDGAIVAGLVGFTRWHWLNVEILWVHEQLRGTGIGSRLLARAEREAIDRDCRGSCLSSFSFQAPSFYLQRGYTMFGQIDDYPPNEATHFFSKTF